MPGSVQCTERRVHSVQCGVQALVSIDQQSEVGVHDGLICYQASQDTNNQDGPSPPGCLITSPLILMIGEFIRSEFEIPFEDFRIILSFLCRKSTNHNPLKQISEWIILIYSRNNRDIDSELGTFITGKSSKQSWPSDRHSSSHPVMELYICIVYLDSPLWGADTHNQ